MNILITNDDGPLAAGLLILQCAARRVFPDARIVTLTPQSGEGGKSLSVTPSSRKIAAEAQPLAYAPNITPADLIYLALGSSHLFLDDGEQFDLVLAGVNHGENVGMDVFHSGTVGMAMLASGMFEVPSLAFSQQIPYPTITHDETVFRTAAEWLPRLLTFPTPQRGMCWSINFPAFTAIDIKLCDISMYSRFHPSIQRHNKTEGGDMYQLEQSYITCVPLRLEAITWHGPALEALGNRFIMDIKEGKQSSNGENIRAELRK
jgi:5'/3'-nucleotidase SurE